MVFLLLRQGCYQFGAMAVSTLIQSLFLVYC